MLPSVLVHQPELVGESANSKKDMLLLRVVAIVGRLAPDMAEEEEIFDVVWAFDVGCSEV